jgi:DNA helicase-2/ATP-dependent DNA helicase PcrA
VIGLPEVSVQDVKWACKVLGLPETAFSGADGADPRLGVLRENATLDVEACPGSGKTTLLVAKLAILARHWNTAERGICVLSHTNAARREIEKKL